MHIQVESTVSSNFILSGEDGVEDKRVKMMNIRMQMRMKMKMKMRKNQSQLVLSAVLNASKHILDDEPPRSPDTNTTSTAAYAAVAANISALRALVSRPTLSAKRTM